jgi:uncharacterized membrane protein (DUF485 family)
MNQSRLASFLEAMANTLIGYVVSFALQLVVYPAFGHRFTIAQNVGIGLVFMAASLARSYVLRRWFNGRLHAAAMRAAHVLGSEA